MSKEYLLQLLQKIPMKDDSPKLVLKQKPNPFIEFDKDSLTATYVGKNLIYSDTTSIQSNRPADRENLIFYYEITIKDLAKSDISVGFADSDFPMNKHPGHTKNSYGYQSDGSVYSNKKAQKRLWKMKDLDVIGCGINYLKKEIFFTHNGILSGPIFYDIDSTDYYPTLGMHGPRQKVKFNFGQEKFKFELQSYIQQEKEAILQIILENEVHHYDIHQVVQSYLYFNGYFETLNAFESASKMQRESTHLIVKDNVDGLNPIQVDQIRKHIEQKQKELMQAVQQNQDSNKCNNSKLAAEKMTGEEENSYSLLVGGDSNLQCHSFQTSQMNENSISLLGTNVNSNFEKIHVEEDEEESKKQDNGIKIHKDNSQNGNISNILKEANNSNITDQLNLSASTAITQQETNLLNQSNFINGNQCSQSIREQHQNQEQNNNGVVNQNSESKNNHQNQQTKSNGNNHATNTNNNNINNNQNSQSNSNHESNGNHNNPTNQQNQNNKNVDNRNIHSNNSSNYHISISNKQNQNQMQIEIDSPLFKKSMPFEKQPEKVSSKDGIFSNGLLDEQGCLSGGEQSQKQNLSPQIVLQNTLEQNKDILEQFRSDVLKLIAIGKCEECIKKIQNELPQLILSSKEILPNLYAQAFIERINNGQIIEAIIFAQKNLSAYQNETFYSYNENGFVIPISINELMGLVAIKDYSKYTGLQFLLSQNQRYIIQDLINKSILNLFGCADVSILELILKQLQLIANRFKQEKYYIGEIYNLKV
ncbi:Ran-binding protein in the microtubule-organising centre protein (macronuclear) [Tetrahymena thermophila SB210]|uniref:Ran-binding protein in the microtubule-organising centre protein n=1 Tax=Tetrahymena thermophila (strain SB210) TaxID=312017 RepID=I7M2G3_TETTS|nr:Ran-binding protein in the microtubule-organising centre protein [Tetrahymena thermophila SB210]EAS00335.2 Ran-binding protein in the microtubule-organising centre protein [Tetrahymena thermophila SB210]|eukprot:XP_001020580.2 Ran-binding protein in the microtubule-organising centre protein [Tetrahymena thermophila SB210]